MKKLSVICALLVACVASKAMAYHYMTGTGFFVSHEGHVLTNHHVVPRCQYLTVYGPFGHMPARMVMRDTRIDLAVLKTDHAPLDIGYISSQKQPLHVGDMVVISGYPGESWKKGNLITRKAQILNTHGRIKGEERWVEFSDVLEKGNSGGPLLDATGNVVGVVAAKAKASVYNEETKRKEVLRHYDLAISLPVIREFLDRAGVHYREADSGLYNNVNYTAQKADRFVINVRCVNGVPQRR